MKIVVDDKIPYLQGVLERYFNQVVYIPGGKIGADDVCDADALLVRTRTVCNQALLEGSRVKVIATATIGHDHIDKVFCAKNGIFWTNAPGCNAYGVVQYVLAAVSYLSVNGYGALSGKTLGIIGVGEVGRRLATVAPYLGLKVLLNDPPRARKGINDSFVDIDTLIEGSDIITMHVPLNHDSVDSTYKMGNSSFFEKFTSPKVFINASRGEVVDDAALIDAIKDGRVSHAVLDVWNGEPNISSELLALADIATPHIAGYSLEGKANGTSMSVNCILRFFFGYMVDYWEPSNLPDVDGNIAIDKGIPVEETLKKAILSTYNIKKDDLALRSNPELFEQLRGTYGVRREMSYFRITGAHEGKLATKLRGLTFKL